MGIRYDTEARALGSEINETAKKIAQAVKHDGTKNIVVACLAIAGNILCSDPVKCEKTLTQEKIRAVVNLVNEGQVSVAAVLASFAGVISDRVQFEGVTGEEDEPREYSTVTH